MNKTNTIKRLREQNNKLRAALKKARVELLYTKFEWCEECGRPILRWKAIRKFSSDYYICPRCNERIKV
jgi:predicted RNA-binding Zn-ribbon protein involved in translation (DUF1610 family)